jgi:hypothetical protein
VPLVVIIEPRPLPLGFVVLPRFIIVPPPRVLPVCPGPDEELDEQPASANTSVLAVSASASIPTRPCCILFDLS